MRLLLKYLLFILLPAYTYGQSGRPDAGITFEVTDSLHNPLAYATVALTPMSGGGKAYATTTDEEGRARFTLPANTYNADISYICLLYTSPSPRDGLLSRMPSSA